MSTVFLEGGEPALHCCSCEGCGLTQAEHPGPFHVCRVCRILQDVVARCGCGKSFTEAEWVQIPCIGMQEVPADWELCDCWLGDHPEMAGRTGLDGDPLHSLTCAGAGYQLELRNCPCGSTLCLDRGGRFSP